jgi:hypothetical protein
VTNQKCIQEQVNIVIFHPSLCTPFKDILGLCDVISFFTLSALVSAMLVRHVLVGMQPSSTTFIIVWADCYAVHACQIIVQFKD